MKQKLVIIVILFVILGIGLMSFANEKTDKPENFLKISAGNCKIEIPLYAQNTVVKEGGEWVNPEDAMFHLATTAAPPLNGVSTRTINQFFLLDKLEMTLKERGQKLIKSQGYEIIEQQNSDGVEFFVVDMGDRLLSRFYFKNMDNSIIVMSSTTPGDLTNEMVQVDLKTFGYLNWSGC